MLNAHIYVLYVEQVVSLQILSFRHITTCNVWSQHLFIR